MGIQEYCTAEASESFCSNIFGRSTIPKSEKETSVLGALTGGSVGDGRHEGVRRFGPAHLGQATLDGEQDPEAGSQEHGQGGGPKHRDPRWSPGQAKAFTCTSVAATSQCGRTA